MVRSRSKLGTTSTSSVGPDRSAARSGSLLKLLVFLYIYVWFRATLPRLRYDQLMDLGWKLLIPLSLGWFMLLAALQHRPRQTTGWNRVVVVGLIGVGVLVAVLRAAD